MSAEGARRSEILETAARLFGSAGFRASLQEIADLCGIQPGSLYHHFESKEALILELVEQYRSDLDAIGEKALADLRSEATPISLQIIAVARAISACAIRHRAAVLQTLYGAPTGATEELALSAKRTPMAIESAVHEILLAGRARGEIRQGVDLGGFASRICRSMLHMSIGLFHQSAAGRQVPATRCRMLLEGLAVDMPADADLDGSGAFAAAEAVIAQWGEDDASQSAQLRSAAKGVFGRQGYDATTMRDIAAAAGMSTGMVYRLVGSKDELLMTIMAAYVDRVTSAWNAVLASDATPLEKLDALVWIDIHVLHRFGAEFRIQQAWWRRTPPNALNLRRSFAQQLPQLRALLSEGERDGFFRVVGASANLRAHSLLDLVWTPEPIVREFGPRRSLELARDTLLRGAGGRMPRPG
jgi:AcrR family transcriptional regulator